MLNEKITMTRLITSLCNIYLLVFLSGCSNAASSNLPPPPAGWTRIEWNPNQDCGYWQPFQAAYVQPDITYTLDIPKDYHLKPGEGASMIWSGDTSKCAIVRLMYWGDTRYRESRKWPEFQIPVSQGLFPHRHGFNWLDARNECDYRISVIKKEADDRSKVALTNVKISTIYLGPEGKPTARKEECYREFAGQEPQLEMSKFKKDTEGHNKCKVVFTYLNEQLKPTPTFTISHPYADCLLQCKPVTSQIINGISFWRADLEVPPRCPCLVSGGYNRHAVVMLSDNGTDLLFDGSNPIAEKIVASLHKRQ